LPTLGSFRYDGSSSANETFGFRRLPSLWAPEGSHLCREAVAPVEEVDE
jgi:hypothetical protein